jgi:hypothetical protein
MLGRGGNHMRIEINRRDFLQTAAGSALCFRAGKALSAAEGAAPLNLISPGCITSKVRVAKVYAGVPGALWPTPNLDLNAEVQRYQAEFNRMRGYFADVDFTVDRLVTQADQIGGIRDALANVDGILVIHLSMGITPVLVEILKSRRPTVIFAAPYSGHEWTNFGTLRNGQNGGLLECILSSNLNDLAVAVRPFRAIHHLREAKIINVSTRQPDDEYLKSTRDRFGTEIKTIGRQPVIDAYQSVRQKGVEQETELWIRQAEKVVEPPRDEIYRSCQLALAFEKILAEERATCITVDCYGSMYRQLPAFPCVGFVRLNNMGLGGICESDLQSALTHILVQGLSGKPGFISDPTMDESVRGIILAHCLGTPKMDGPGGQAAPYKLRTIMERQEGCVPQVRMRLGQKVTQLRLADTDRIIYFTGTITDVPDTERGCRTKITVQIDGDPEKLWQEWTDGLHRTTVYGDITPDLKRFCRFKGIHLIQEA